MIFRISMPRVAAACLTIALATPLAAMGSANPEADAEHAGFGARLLLAQKDGRLALFLPESHIGSPAQEDNYFRTVIRPAFAASSALLAERSSVSWFDKTYDRAGCPEQGEIDMALDTALNDALRRHAPAVPPALRSISPVDRIDKLGRFIRFYLLFVDVHQREMGKAPVDTASSGRGFKVRNAQSRVLLTEAPRRDISVEDTSTWLRAYCAIAPTQRASLIADAVHQSAIPPDPADSHLTAAQLSAATYRINDAAYRQALANMRATLRAPFPAGGINAPPAGKGPRNANYGRTWAPAELVMNKFMLVERSRAWVADLPAVLARERLPFYGLGAAHFADAPFGPGLITLLRAAGYTVSLVDDRPALEMALARLPPPTAAVEQPLKMRTLSGGCQRDGESYGCNWADKTTSYLVVNARQSQQQEVWSACFERERLLGPERSCVSAVRRVGAERAADLSTADRRNEIVSKASPPTDP